jgi:glucose-1-phosphate cytidylyltransferase
MKVVILCGGKGTRLREETEYRPKPMVDIGSRPILWHIMKIYAHYGFKEFVLCLGYKGSMIKDYFMNYEAMNNDFTINLGKHNEICIHNNHTEKDWVVTLVNTGEEAQTGSRVKRVEKYVDGDTFMLTYGDGVANVDIARLMKFHQSHGKLATMTGVRPSSRFGELVLDGDDRVRKFNEKPQVMEGLINGGYFVLGRKVFDYLRNDDECVFEKEPLENLSADGQLMVYRHDSFWQCMDTYREMELLNSLWKSNQAPWRVW